MGKERATFAAGCFWGTERYFKKQFKDGISNVKVGYTGGKGDKPPTYEEVCTGRTGHAEAATFEFDTDKVKYEDLVRWFFRFHNPTTLNSQGNDKGTQYRSAIFYHNDEQRKIAEAVKARAQPHWQAPIVTEISPAVTFHNAEDYHQEYLDRNPGGYCNHRVYIPEFA